MTTQAKSDLQEAYERGLEEGLDCRRGYCPLTQDLEAEVVAIIRNLTEIAVEGWLRDGLLYHDAGVIVGYLLRKMQ